MAEKKCPYAPPGHKDPNGGKRKGGKGGKHIKRGESSSEEKWYTRVFGCGKKEKVKTTTAAEEDEAFWSTFYRAYTALCTPVILGEIERKSLDVKIVYANTAAFDFTGYDPGEVSESNPNGLIGRSVTELMEQNLSDAHAGFVASWLCRRGMVSSDTKEATSMDGGGEEEDGSMKAVEGISRRVTMITSDGRALGTDAALSFFTSSGLNKVIGIFSFKSAEDLDIISLKGLTFSLEYVPARLKTAYAKTVWYVEVEPPSLLSEFSKDDLWRIKPMSEGVELTSGDISSIKSLIRKQVFAHLGKFSADSDLDVTFVENDKHSLSRSSMDKIFSTLVSSINDSKSDKNMHLSVSSGRADERAGICSFKSEDEDDN